MPYSVWLAMPLLKELPGRYVDYPLPALLKDLRSKLSHQADAGRAAPFPYVGVLMQVFEVEAAKGRYRVTPLYQIDRDDDAVEIVEIGIVRLSSR